VFSGVMLIFAVPASSPHFQMHFCSAVVGAARAARSAAGTFPLKPQAQMAATAIWRTKLEWRKHCINLIEALILRSWS
jgi:hypothetical protein